MKRLTSLSILVAVIALLLVDRGNAQKLAGEKEIISYFEKGLAQQKAGKHAESVPFFEKAAELAPGVFGPNHLNTASIHRTAGVANYHAHRYSVAEKHYRTCLEIREAKLPKDDMRIAAVLNDLGICLEQQGKYGEAEKRLLGALAICEAKFPKDHLESVATLVNLGGLYHATARLEKAASYFERASQSLAKARGKDDLDVAYQLHNLSDTYRLMGRFQEAEAIARQSMEIRQTKLGKNHFLLADNLNILGLIEHSQGKYKDAEVHLTRALEMREKQFGKDSLGVATCLANVSMLHRAADRVDEAETCLRRALAIREKFLGPDHPQVAIVLESLGGLLASMGRREEGIKLLKRSLAIQEAKLGPNNPKLQATLISLAGVELDRGRWQEAEPLCLRALKVVEDAFGKDHVNCVGILNNLAIVYMNTNRSEQALATLLRVKEVREGHFGKGHPDSAYVAYNLGSVYQRMGSFAKAEEYYQIALKSAETHAGKNSEHVGDVLRGFVTLYVASKRIEDARKAQERSLDILQLRLRDMFAFSSEAAMYDYIEAHGPKLLSLISLALQEENDADLADASLTWLLRLRGTVFDAAYQYRQAQRILKDEDLEEKLTRYRSQKTFLANAAVNPPIGVSAEKLKRQMADAEQEISELEKNIRRNLARRVPNVFAAREEVSVKQVCEKLPSDGALIEFCNMPVRSFTKGTWSKQYHYIAALRTRNGRTKLVDLGPGKAIDDGVEELRKEFTDFQEKLLECEPGAVQDLELAQEKQFRKKSVALHTKLFAPLQPHLGNAKQLYLVCDASLNRLPFEALVDADGKYLIESYRCVYLSSGRDLLRAPAARSKGTVVFAGPDYKLSADARLAQVEKLLSKKDSLITSRGLPGRDLRSLGWKNLPGAAAEAKDIHKIIDKGAYGPVKAYLGPQALEEVLKAMPAPRVLHLATHGFFLDKEIDAEPPPEDGAGAGRARGRLKRAGNPLLRSGIVLAGANTVGDKNATVARVDDGWVTAEEIALLNLQGTELVVLSACQTGLGDIKNGEGVFGLRRAFLTAGVRSLVTSLFEVPDTETRDLMRRFYIGLDAGQGKLRALHSAQRSFIDDRRKKQGAAHPFFWSCFILVGDAD